MKKRKQFLAVVVLCLMALSSQGRPVDSRRDVDRRPRLAEKVIRIVRVIINGDGLTPPFPAPKP